MNRPDIFAFLLILAVSIASGPRSATSQPSEDVQTWPRGALRLETPIPDLSALNHQPAGRHGKIQAVGDELFFADGTPARFWGANLQAYALFTTEPRFMRAHAQRLSRLGFNLVRIHHHDSHWVQPNIFGSEAQTTRKLDAFSLKKLDQWIAALKAEGLYIWLDLHVGRSFTNEDGVEDFEEIAKGETSIRVKGFSYISPSIEALMLDFQDKYLRHINKITGLSYAEDPAVIAVMITNENDLTHHFGNALLPDKNVPRHNAVYMAAAREFALENGIDPELTWRSWLHGPSKLFLNELERRFNDRMIENIEATGFEGLITTTSLWGGMSVAGLPSLTRGSMVDAHSYGSSGEVFYDPRTRSGFLDWLSIGQVVGMPFSVSEWNIGEFPGDDRFIAPLSVAVRAAHQGWDAPIVYGYAQQPLNGPLRPTNWSMAEDPAMMAMMPAAALLYRQGHVRLAEKTYALCPDHEAFFGNSITPASSVGIRTIVEQSRLVTCMPDTPALPWLQASVLEEQQHEILDTEHSYLEPDAQTVAADTGDFYRAFNDGLIVIDTAKTQAAAGHLSDKTVATTNVAFEVENPTAAVVVQSLDDEEITTSGRILVSLAGRAVPEELSFRIEPLVGRLQIKASPRLTLRFPDQKKAAVGAHSFQDGMHVIDLEKLGAGNWFYLE